MLRRTILLTGLGLCAACHDIDTSRATPVRGTIGEEVFGIFCDRIAAGSLREDLNGDSFRKVCHKADGEYSDTVDETLLPKATTDAKDKDGNPVSVEKQQEDRANALARIGALVRHRKELIDAIDTVVPANTAVPIKDLANEDPTKTCNAPSGKSGTGTLAKEVAALLGRFTDLYNDGTMPHSTEALGDFMLAVQASPDAQAALARLGSRLGYRPVDTSLGATRGVASYPHMRDLANATLGVITKPGVGHDRMAKAMDAMHEELRTVKADPPAPALAISNDALAGRPVLSRPRDNLEALGTVMFFESPKIGSGTSRYIVRRDRRGYAQVAKPAGIVPSPFVDKDGDGLADVDPLGRFITSNGAPPPSPFYAFGAQTAPSYDTFGRAQATSALLYDYIDTSHTFSAQVITDMRPLVNPDPKAQHETMMYALSGAYSLFGKRDGFDKTVRAYNDPQTGSSTLTYDAFHPESSPLVNLIYALGQMMGDPSTDDVLAYSQMLMTSHQSDLARVAAAGFDFKATSDKHAEAKLAPKSTFWDEMIDTAVKIEKEPGLLEDVMRSLGSDQGKPSAQVFAKFMTYRDRITYDRNNLNGPAVNADLAMTAVPMSTPVDRTKPQTGANRSNMYKFLQSIHDTNGVAACNKQGAKVHATLFGLNVTMPITGSYAECEVFKIDNLAKFFLDSTIGRAYLYLRNDTLRNGILGIGAATVDLMEQSSGIKGFWDGSSSKTLRPRPEYLSRQVYFDLTGDSPNSGDKNYKTNRFLTDLVGLHSIGTSVCPERTLPDPLPGAVDSPPGGIIKGLRACSNGDWLDQRDPDATFIMENFNAFSAMTPLITAFALHNREDLFLEIMEAMYRHWPNDDATECGPTGDPKTNGRYCTHDGIVSYEPLLAEALPNDLLPALSDLVKTLDAATIAKCTAFDPTTKKCTTTANVDGISVFAQAKRSLLDPDLAKKVNLAQRDGTVSVARNDGKLNAQVTPIYLLTDAFSSVDTTLANEPGRMAEWRLARSQLVDQFLGAKGSAFTNAGLPEVTPTLITMLRAQIFAHCPDTFMPPYKRCAWARDELASKLSDMVKGPMFATTMDLLDSIRSDEAARTELDKLLQYLADTASTDALPSMFACVADAMQFMRDDDNLVPVFHAVASALGPKVDANGAPRPSLIDSQTALLSRISAKSYDENGKEICSKEVDPNEVLPMLLKNLTTPIKDSTGRVARTPLDVVIDTIADVNRVQPQRTDKLDAGDYGSISKEVGDFLLNKERGLEQFYEVVRQGTKE